MESLGAQLKEALVLRRRASISIWDAEGGVQWLSEGALGPDEHSLVIEALEQFRADRNAVSHENGVEDGPYALFLPVRAPAGDPVGVAMILADVRSIGEGAQERVAAPVVRAILQRLAVLMKPAGLSSSNSLPSLALLEPSVPAPSAAPKPAGAAEAPAAISPQEVSDLLEFELTSGEVAMPDVSTPRASAVPEVRAPRRSATGEAEEMLVLEFSAEPPVLSAAPLLSAVSVNGATADAPALSLELAADPATTAEREPPPKRHAPAPAPASHAAQTRARAAVERARTPQPPPAPSPPPVAPTVEAKPAPAKVTTTDADLILEVLQFGKLRSGGQSRRFQVQARTAQREAQRMPAAMDALVLQRLVSWLAANRSSWSSQPTGFTVNLSIATLEDERFTQRIAADLNSNGLSPEVLGFEIAEALCTQRRAHVERFITQCEKAGLWVVVDDFSFDSQVLPLLRSKAVRLVKLDQRLTSAALKDKLSQALVIATVQAVKVLGIHCAAKQVESQAALQWLTAIGCDFAQGSVLHRTQPLEALGL